jgi:hypothetical protein
MQMKNFKSLLQRLNKPGIRIEVVSPSQSKAGERSSRGETHGFVIEMTTIEWLF